MENSNPRAAMVMIGNEILNGRTQDQNLPYITKQLNALGIICAEVRVVPDITVEIVTAVNALRARYDYVFTSGGIGPTHDDITTHAIAQAFGVQVITDTRALQMMEERYGDSLERHPARRRMAEIPQGAELILNQVTAAPGYRVGNVFVLAGVPEIFRNMFENLRAQLRQGQAIHSQAVRAFTGESVIANQLGAIQAQFPQTDIGSYPQKNPAGKHSSLLVVRSTEMTSMTRAIAEIIAMLQRVEVDFEVVK